MLRTTAFKSNLARASRRFNHEIVRRPDAKKAQAFLSHYQHTVDHAGGTTNLWKWISVATIPILAVCAYYVGGRELEHLEHLSEVMKVPSEEWPPELEYQNVRAKKFFWGDGDKTLFWSWTNHKKN